MLSDLYAELTSVEFQYHEISSFCDECIGLVTKTFEPDSVLEVIQIKALADKYDLITTWNGKDITIKRMGTTVQCN